MPTDKNIQAISKIKTPKTRRQVQSLLGLINFYRKFCPDYSKRTKELTNLTKEKNKFKWTEQAQAEFEDIKQTLLAIPTLNLPDMSKEFLLFTDSSGFSLGCVLAQLDENKFPCPIAFASRKLNDAEKNYPTTERELLAIVWATGYFKCYLLGKKFTIYTDHAALVYTLKIKDSTSRVNRWLISLEQFNFETKYIKGRCNSVADFMSRWIEHDYVDEETMLKSYIPQIKVNNTPKDNSKHVENPESVQTKVKYIECNDNERVTLNNSNISHASHNVYIDKHDLQENTLDVSEEKKINSNSICNNNNQEIEYNTESPYNSQNKKEENLDNFSEHNNNLNYFEMCNVIVPQQKMFKIDNKDFIDKIKIAQQQDNFTSTVINKLNKNKPTRPQFMLYFMEDGILKCKNLKDKSRRGKLTKIVLPLALVPTIFNMAHDSMLAGHAGFFKTRNRIATHFFWKTMYKHIKQLVDSCTQCLERKAHQRKGLAEIQSLPVANYPFLTVHSDISGPYCTTINGNKYILVFIDSFSKWVEAYPIPSMESDVIADKLADFISRHGCPDTFVSDRASNYLSNAIEKVYKLLNIKHIATSSYHPSSNSKVERVHGSISNILCQLVNQNHNDWDIKLKFALLALRSAVHTSTQETPYFITTGRDMRLPYNMLLEKPKFSYSDCPSYCELLIPTLQTTFQQVKENLIKVSENQEEYRSRSAVDKKLKVGDLIMLYTPKVQQGLCKKFTKFNNGPFRIIKKLSPVNFKIQDINNPSKIQNVHVDRINKISVRPIFPEIQTNDIENKNEEIILKNENTSENQYEENTNDSDPADSPIHRMLLRRCLGKWRVENVTKNTENNQQITQTCTPCRPDQSSNKPETHENYPYNTRSRARNNLKN